MKFPQVLRILRIRTKLKIIAIVFPITVVLFLIYSPSKWRTVSQAQDVNEIIIKDQSYNQLGGENSVWTESVEDNSHEAINPVREQVESEDEIKRVSDSVDKSTSPLHSLAPDETATYKYKLEKSLEKNFIINSVDKADSALSMNTSSLSKDSSNLEEKKTQDLGLYDLNTQMKKEQEKSEIHFSNDDSTERTLPDWERKLIKAVASHNFNRSSTFSNPKGLNCHIWDHVCGFQVESLSNFILYPMAPSRRKTITTFRSYEKGNKFGQRIFGFLHPDITGEYKFGISSEGNSELWVSNDANPINLHRIAFIGSEYKRQATKEGNYKELATQVSKEVNLIKGKRYFVEVVYKHVKGQARFEVAWMKPGTLFLEIIPESYVSLAVNDIHIEDNTVGLSEYREENVQAARDTNILQHMEFIDFGESLPECEYEPSYYVRHKLVRFQGARNKSNTHFVAVYPPDGTNNSLPLMKNQDVWWTENGIGNDVIDDQTAKEVGKKFSRQMEIKYNGTFKVVKVTSLERAVDILKGDRYLIELEVEDIYSGQRYQLSEFIYYPRNSSGLCFPRGFRWSKQANVNIIVPLKNGGRWAMYLIQNVAEIVQRTRDPNVRLVIIDYESADIDVEAVLRRSSLHPYMYTVVRVPGDRPFRRAEALQRGADAVKEPNSILFFCDLHLRIPVNLVKIIRKHCVEGKMAFAPVVKRLRCGHYPSFPFGYWETLGFGLFALYKSDFDDVGGMNVEEFAGWGGEDWELLDRILESRREVERLKIPGFYHFYHPPYDGFNARADYK